MKNFIIALKNDSLRHFFLTQMRAKMNPYGTFFNASGPIQNHVFYEGK
jgi:hypothetical protein